MPILPEEGGIMKMKIGSRESCMMKHGMLLQTASIRGWATMLVLLLSARDSHVPEQILSCHMTHMTHVSNLCLHSVISHQCFTFHHRLSPYQLLSWHYYSSNPFWRQRDYSRNVQINHQYIFIFSSSSLFRWMRDSSTDWKCVHSLGEYRLVRLRHILWRPQ